MPRERSEQLHIEVEFSLYYFSENMRMFFDMVGAKIVLDDTINQGKKGLHHDNTCSDLMEACMDTVFYQLRHRLKDDFRRYEQAGK